VVPRTSDTTITCEVGRVEPDVNRVGELARLKEEENWAFRAYLKGWDRPATELDAIVHRLYHEVAPHVDCRACRNCCKRLRPNFSEEEVQAIAEVLGMPASRVHDAYLAPDLTEGGFTTKTLPCPFLVDQNCRAHEARPEGCRTFPYLEKDFFASRLMGVVEFCAICPIVFNVYERLKGEVGWAWKRKSGRAGKRSKFTEHPLNPPWQFKYRRPYKT